MAAAYARAGGIRRWDWLFLAVIGVAFLGVRGERRVCNGRTVDLQRPEHLRDGRHGGAQRLGWVAGETVHVTVDDASGDAWSRDADVTAADDGTLTHSLTLPDVTGDYTVSATAFSFGQRERGLRGRRPRFASHADTAGGTH